MQSVCFSKDQQKAPKHAQSWNSASGRLLLKISVGIDSTWSNLTSRDSAPKSLFLFGRRLRFCFSFFKSVSALPCCGGGGLFCCGGLNGRCCCWPGCIAIWGIWCWRCICCCWWCCCCCCCCWWWFMGICCRCIWGRSCSLRWGGCLVLCMLVAFWLRTFCCCCDRGQLRAKWPIFLHMRQPRSLGTVPSVRKRTSNRYSWGKTQQFYLLRMA